jgi:hypothetical protein
MILRRVINHFRKQEWTAIAIDFLIVVLGVVVATQVSNWNAARADRDRADAYLGRLANDLETDIAAARRKIEFWSAVSDYGATALRYAEAGDAGGKSNWNLLLAYFQASQVDEYYVTDTTYEELKSAGELGLIRDEALRSALGSYYSLGSNPALTERPKYREHVRGIIPVPVQSYIWTNCYATDDQGDQSLLACDAPRPEAEIAAIVDALAADDGLMEELRYWMSTLQIASIIGRDSIEGAGSLKALIDTARRS